MIAVAAALALLLAQAPAQATAQPPAPLAAPTPVSPVVVVAPPAEPDPEKVAADLAVIYDQSCGGRIYGMYADACNGLAARLSKAQAEARRAAARKAKLGKSAPAATSPR